MSNVIPFKFKTNDIRVLTDEDGELWFVAKDVADVLGYSDAHKMTSRLDKDEVQNRQIGGSGFNNKGTLLINESGLYSSILTSKKEEVKPFKKWVTSELLPSIRKTGTYDARPKPVSRNHSMFSLAVKTLNPDPASKLVMLQRYGAMNGVDMSFLPDYAESEGLHHSMSELLKKHNVELSAQKANKVLLETGYLEIKTRKSSSGKKKEFKCVTEKGQKYGCNLVSPNNPSETQAHWFDDKFPELLGIIEKG